MSGTQDRAIDSVLQALAQAEPDPAMQDRLLASLQQAAAEPVMSATARSLPLQKAWSRPAVGWWLATAAALLVGAAGTSLPRWYRASGDRLVGTAPPRASAEKARMPHALQRHGLSLQAAEESHVSAARRGAPGVRSQAAAQPAAALRVNLESSARLRHTAAGPAPGKADLVDRNASFPAPSLPLTEQERLMLRLAHHEPSPQLAQLTRATLDTSHQQEQDAFAEFFVARAPLRGQQEPPLDVSPAGQP